MSARLRETKAMNAKNAEILRGLLKRSENKFCVDCKRNDARWASTNLGIFLCIRCSGIHRGLGVHISRVRSVDLDTWSPEQIANMERWGNAKANIYWEAHLKPGHQPPEHKIEQFIRSKYESKRWAMEGPVPDPATLGEPSPETSQSVAGGGSADATSASSAKSATTKAAATTSKQSAIDLLAGAFDDPSPGPSANSAFGFSNASRTSQAQAFRPATSVPAPPLSGNNVGAAAKPAAGTSVPAARSTSNSGGAAATSTGNGFFDLDFGSPASGATSNSSNATGSATTNHNGTTRKNANDIMSLFSSPSVASPAVTSTQHAGAGAGGLDAFSSLSLGGSGNASYSAQPYGTPTTASNNQTQRQAPTSTYSHPARPASNSISAGNPWAASGTSDAFSSAAPSAARGASSVNMYTSPPSAPAAANKSQPPAYNNDFFSTPASSNNYTSATSATHTTSNAGAGMDFFNSQDIWGAPASNAGSNNNRTSGDAFGGFSSATNNKASGGFDDLWS